jgi:hypothetical protein
MSDNDRVLARNGARVLTDLLLVTASFYSPHSCASYAGYRMTVGDYGSLCFVMLKSHCRDGPVRLPVPR